MSDELVDELVLVAQLEMQQYRERAYDRIKGEVQVLGTVLSLTEGGPARDMGLSLLERLTEPILTDIAVELVRAIVDNYPHETVVVTPHWLESLPLDRNALARETGLDLHGIERVLNAMFGMLRMSEAIAEVDDVRVTLLPERSRSKETGAPGGSKPVAGNPLVARSQTGELGRAASGRSAATEKTSSQRAVRKGDASETAPPRLRTLRKR